MKYFKYDKLAFGERVNLILPETELRFIIEHGSENCCYLGGINCCNDRVFEFLNIKEKNDWVSNIVGYECDGCFPEVKSLDDLKKVISALDMEASKLFKKSSVEDSKSFKIVCNKPSVKLNYNI